MQTFGDTVCFDFSLELQKQEYLRVKSVDIDLANIIILSKLPLWIKINSSDISTRTSGVVSKITFEGPERVSCTRVCMFVM